MTGLVSIVKSIGVAKDSAVQMAENSRPAMESRLGANDAFLRIFCRETLVLHGVLFLTR